MRVHTLVLALVIAGVAPGVGKAQAVPRTDTPRAGTFRVTFEPIITTWDYEFTSNGRQRIGASLPATVFVHQEKRETPLTVDFGITNRIALSVRLPLVRVRTRESYHVVDSTGKVDSAGRALDSLLNDTTYAFGSLMDTPRRLRYFAGDAEVQAKYRFLEAPNYALSGALVVRLPTGHQDSPNRLFDIPTGDHQTDIELQVAQELTLFNRLWLNTMLRAARQQPGTRARRVGPQSTLLLPHAALATLNWDPGDYVAIDVAPMYRFAKTFGVGFTVGYFTKQRDRYTYRSAQDSITIATRLGAPVAASVLDAGTAERRTRLGVAITYVASNIEGSLSFEQTVTAAGGHVPAASVLRIVMRTSRWLF